MSLQAGAELPLGQFNLGQLPYLNFWTKTTYIHVYVLMCKSKSDF
jgi:hypothetical protein